MQETGFVLNERFIFVDFGFDFLATIKLVKAGRDCFFGGAYILLFGLFYLVYVGTRPDLRKAEVLFECHSPIIQAIRFVGFFLSGFIGIRIWLLVSISILLGCY